MVDQAIQKNEEEKRISEEQAAKDRSWKIPICYDDDEDNTIAITPVSSPIDEPDNSLSKGEWGTSIYTIPKRKDRTLSSITTMIYSSDDDSYERQSSMSNASPPDERSQLRGFPQLIMILSLPDYKAFYIDNDHFKERSSGSTTTHVDFSQYDSFIFDLSNDQFPPTDRSDLNHEEFADELAHIISPPEYDHFCFKIEPELGNYHGLGNDIFPTREPRVHVPNVLPTHPTLDTDFILLSEPLFAYIVWIFLPFLTYPVAPPYLLSTRNEDTIFDPGISMYHSFMPDVSHRSGTFIKFNVYPDRLNESPMMILPSTCFPMDQ
ncbi:hypothetical protein Tco_0853876 [Tanacetum coccineum]